MTGHVPEGKIPAGFRGFLRRIAIVVKDIYRRAYNLKRLVAEGKVDANFESLLADSVGLNQQARVDTASQRVASDVLADTDGNVVFSRAQAQSNAGEIRASNATITGPTNYSIAAHHGTPHKVDKFTTAKIGTGEGSQAYGWGLYFAEEKKVANGYRDRLSQGRPPSHEFKEKTGYSLGEYGVRKLLKVTDLESAQAVRKSSQFLSQYSAQELLDLSPVARQVTTNPGGGNLYTAELDVEPEDLLDWDKPLSEQTKSVRDAVTALIKDRVPKEIADVFLSNSEAGGGSLYTLISDSFGESAQGTPAKRASEALLAAGIPGIRYLDGGSRSEGQGTYNYVAFDENLIKITEENGNRIAAADALAAPATGSTNYSIGKKDSLRVKMTRTALTDAALNQTSWKDWYEEHQSTLDEYFGDHAQLFQDILSVTSQAASVKANVGLALKAFGQFHRGEEFSGFLPAVIKNLNRLRENTQVRGQKISAYKNSNDGKVDEAVIDRHIARLIFGVDSPSKAQFAKAQKILTEIANEIGWTPRQVQAALWAHSIYKSGKTPESYGAYLKKLESRGTLAERIGDIGSRGGTSNADGGGRGRFAPESTADGAGLTNYSIRSVEHFKNDKRFDKLVKDGRVVIGHDIEEFKGMHILLHSPDNAFAGTIKLTDGEEIQGKGGVYYPALYANKNYFWASTEATVMTTAKHLNEIGQKNGGKILMALVSAPVEKLFSSTSMATGVVKFLNSLTSDTKAGLSKEDLNSMLVAASKVEFVKKGAKPKKFKMTLAKGDGLEKNLSKVDALLEPTGSIFQVRKMFSESLADQLSKHLKTNPEASNYVGGILADAENKHAKSAIKRGTLSKASIMQGLGNLFTEPFLRDFQDHGNGKIYAVLEVDGMVDGVASKAHDSYPFTLVPKNKKSKVKLHVLNQAVDWQDDCSCGPAA